MWYCVVLTGGATNRKHVVRQHLALRLMHTWRQTAEGTAEAGSQESRGPGRHAHG